MITKFWLHHFRHDHYSPRASIRLIATFAKSAFALAAVLSPALLPRACRCCRVMRRRAATDNGSTHLFNAAAQNFAVGRENAVNHVLHVTLQQNIFSSHLKKSKGHNVNLQPRIRNNKIQKKQQRRLRVPGRKRSLDSLNGHCEAGLNMLQARGN
jgi:hypothetical protein